MSKDFPFEELQEKTEKVFQGVLAKVTVDLDWDDVNPLFNAFVAEIKVLNEGGIGVYVSRHRDGDFVELSLIPTVELGHHDAFELAPIQLSKILTRDLEADPTCEHERQDLWERLELAQASIDKARKLLDGFR